jgi:hypothetical protein
MPIADYLRGFPRRHSQRRRHQPQLRLECLEDRTVPSIIFNNASTASTSDGGGPVIDHVHVELIFWGSGWSTGDGPTLRSQTEAAVDSITGGPYLSYLSQYRASIGTGVRIGSVTIDSSSPGTVFHDQDVEDMLAANIANQTLPDPASDPELLYAVIAQPGSNSNFPATHSYLFPPPGPVNARYLWTVNRTGLDGITYYFSHELAESVTDPEGTAIQVNPRNDFAWNEIGDGGGADGAQPYSYRLNGYLVQSYFSQVDHAYVVPTGQAQNFFVSSSRMLTVNGGQLANPNDTITIDQANGVYRVTMNGEVAQFDAKEFFRAVAPVTTVTVNTGNGDDTVDIENTLSGWPATVNLGSGTSTVGISSAAQNLSNIREAVTINGGTGFDSLFLWDRNGTAGRTFIFTGQTITTSGAGTVTYNNLSNLVLLAGNQGNTITVQNTSTPLTLNGGGGLNILAGSSAASTWNIMRSDAGTLSSPNISGNVSFSSIQNLVGGSGSNAFIFNDGASVSGNIRGGGGGALDYSAYNTAVNVNLQTATATGVGGSFASIQSLTGGGGNNMLVGADVTDIWNLTGSNTGSVHGGGSTVTFSAFQNLRGGAVANTFMFGDGASLSGNLDGGGGGALDYSAYSGSVIVDLQTATATGVGGSIANIQNVVGGNGGGAGVYNILVGNGGNVLIGGNGRRNLLIAGSSASTLIGGDDDDILIGGTTAYDMDLAALTAIMNYWSATADDYGTRVANLLAGNGVPLLDATMVTSNGGGNTLSGGLGLNLYYGNSADATDFDPSSGSVFVPV